MQDRYAGDIGDFVKFGLLRALSKDRKLGVAWYLYPNESHNKDGRHIDYLKDDRRWRSFDPDLFDALKTIAERESRNVADVERSGILGPTIFAGKLLLDNSRSIEGRRQWRAKWFDETLATLDGCDLVFADPDNGLCDDDKFAVGRVKDWKRIPEREVRALAKDRTAVIYHHNTRYKGGHEAEISHWIEVLGHNTMAIRSRYFSTRTFFVVNPVPTMRSILEDFADRWGPRVVFHDN